MRKIIFSLLFLISISDLFGQDAIQYLNKANEAEYEFIQGNHVTAKSIFTLLEKKYGKLKFKDYFYLGISNYCLNDSINGLKYLLKYIDLYGSALENITNSQRRFPYLKFSQSALAQLETAEKKKHNEFRDSSNYKKAYKPTVDSLQFYSKRNIENQDSEGNLISAEQEIKNQKALLNNLKRMVFRIQLYTEMNTLF
jgi:hypothetical protein